ncbi:MAG TPA: hypothetical protein VLF43_05225 [Candidatus Saccharimonadales bacterium]|nr:hypothetical protein [Candidatus Saccharimonadales bacterium]
MVDLVIVDEGDEVIGHKNRDSFAPEDIYRVARLIIVNSHNQVLMAQRALIKKKDPGLVSELDTVAWVDVDALEQDVSRHPEKYGYNFEQILKKILQSF